jgi:hypothetical protein
MPVCLQESLQPTLVAPAEEASLDLTDSAQAIARDVEAVGRIGSVPTLLEVLCETTGMGFAAVARVTEHTWTACAVQDKIQFGLKAGSQLDINTTLCVESRAMRAPIIIDQASTHPRYCNHHTPQLYKIESYVSVPIIFSDGQYFGNLCAIDPRPAKVSAPSILFMFERFALLIARQLESETTRAREHTALLDERAVSELREQFIAILGHDLRNPLQALYMGCDGLAKRHPDPWTATLVSRMRSNARRMAALIDDVLDFARGRLGSGLGIHMHSAADLDIGLDAVVKELQDARPERSIISSIRVKRAVTCDVGRIQQLVSNLLGNAITHGSESSPVRFTAAADDDQLVLEVWNDGDPIPPESMGMIFAPFWRRVTSKNRDGLGLGLYISSQIVLAHKGQLTVTSSKEAGTKFTARLPRIH